MPSNVSLPLHELLDAAPDGFLVTDRDGRIVWANATAHTLFGYEPEELRGLSVEDLVPQRLRSVHERHRENYHENPRGRPMGLGLHLVGRRKDGSEVPVEISLSPLETESGLLVTAVVRDVSERRRLEEERNVLELELQTERERDRIAMDLHDGVMQDIYAVALGLELALVPGPEPSTRDGKAIEQAIDQLHEVIRNIRSFIFDLRPREFAGTLAEALSGLTEEFRKNSQILTDVRIEDGPQVDAMTAVAVYHIAHESLSNVRKHARATKVVVHLSFSDGRGCLEVIDNGTGFDATKAPPEGHHGLRNMAARARATNGELDVTSTPGAGTRLSLSFPVALE
jgi:PAS domain S-box-containing protein